MKNNVGGNVMKKLSLMFFSLLIIFALSGCGSNDAGPIEPTKEHVCAFCNMEVYTKDEEMGVFTAQAIDSNGNHLFFDDSGCLLNYERKTGEALSEKWVRNYLTKEWIAAKDAVPVHADMKTPMKYGYSFFATQEDADKFVNENTNVNAVLSSWDEIDQVSNERYMKKMKMTEEGSEHSEHEHGDDQEESEGSH